MPDTDGRARSRLAVQDVLVELGLGPYEFARKADVDPGTLTDFLAGKRWPQPATRKKISLALGWPPQGIDMIARGEPLPGSAEETVGTLDQDAGVLLSLPPGALDDLSPADREEAISAAKATLLERAREIRRRVGQ